MHANLSRTLVSAAFWTSCYCFVKWCLRSEEKAHHFTNLAHSLVDTLLCVTSFYAGREKIQNNGDANTYLQEVAFATCTGYYMLDICWQLKRTPKDTAMLAHHVVTLAATTYVLVTRKCGCDGVTTLFLLEVSTPFQQVRWFLNQLNLRETILNTVNQCLCWSIFVAARIVGISYFGFTILTSGESNVYQILFAVGFYAVSTVLSLRYLFKISCGDLLKKCLPAVENIHILFVINMERMIRTYKSAKKQGWQKVH